MAPTRPNLSAIEGACISLQQLQQLVSERVAEADEEAIVKHLSNCRNCQQALEEVAGGGAELSHLNRYLDSGETTDLSRTETVPETHYEHILSYLTPTDHPDMIGRIGSYEVCGFVGHGSTGIVLKALEPRLNRFVAIKILSPTLANNGASRRRFEREARAVAAVVNEHVVPIFVVSEHQGLPYLVMQYVGGGSLHRRIENQGPLDATEVVRIGMQVASGLEAAHAQGIVHRDVKPANVMLETGVERAMVTDFGMARVADEATMTRSGVISGTPQFMSPEQAKGELIDRRSDLFSLGSLLYTASTGRPPFQAETVYGVIQRVCETEPRPIRDLSPEIPEWLAAFITKLTSKRREDRFNSAGEVRELLATELAHMQSPTFVREPEREWFPTPAASRRKPAIAAAVALLVFLVAGMNLAELAGSDDRPEQVAAEPPGDSVEEQWANKPSITLAASPDQDKQSTIDVVDKPCETKCNTTDDAGKNTESCSTGECNTVQHESTPSKSSVKLVNWRGSQRPIEENQIAKTMPVKQDGQLSIRADLANIELISADTNEVKFEIVRKVLADDRAAAEQLFESHEVSIEQVDDGLVVTSQIPNQRNLPQDAPRFYHIDMRVTVPRAQHLDLRTAGNIAVDNVNGRVAVDTKGGNVSLRDVGPLTLRTAGGNVAVASVDGSAKIETAGGNVAVASVSGSANIKTAGGDIHIKRIGGAVTAHTGGGNIVLEWVEGAADAATGGGNIVATIASQPEEACQLATAAGNIMLAIGKEIGCELSVLTQQGSLHAPGFGPHKKNSTSLQQTLNGEDQPLL